MSEFQLGALVAKAREWMRDDPDPATVAELERLITAADEAGLASRLNRRLAFGTAGLRGAVGAGPNRMNRKVVMQTSAGFANFLLSRVAGVPSVVVGFDARLDSERFALDAAEVFAGAGLAVTLLAGPTATPITAFAVRHLNADAGVMITASHNPPQDNGYKVYLGGADGGSQIAPPIDAQIAAQIDRVAGRSLAGVRCSSGFTRDGGSVSATYVRESAAFIRSAMAPAAARDQTEPSEAGDTVSGNLTVAYTAMHGVGHNLWSAVLEEAGLPGVASVPEQEQPDGRFPTVAFPNPEEPGALDLAKDLADRIDADLIIAHDPDADRLAIALPSRVPGSPARESSGPSATVTGFTQLTGNQVGLLLGWECAELFARGKNSGGDSSGGDSSGDERGALAATVVSSPALGVVAKEFGLEFVQTLSGFKWVSRVPNLVFGFEEALGYLVNPGIIRDKDGISAASLALAMAQRLHREGKSLWDRLDEASMRFGHFASDQLVLRMDSSDAVEALSASIRQHPPTAFGEVEVERFTDFSDPAHHFGGMPVAANVIQFDLCDGSRVMIRPSGTEPKLKVYVDASCDNGSLDERRSIAESQVAALRKAASVILSGSGGL